MSWNNIKNNLAFFGIVLTPLLVGACGHGPSAPSHLAAASDVVTIEVTPENRPRVESLLRKMSEARDSQAAMTVGDLVSIVPTPDADAGIVPTAFPNALSVQCSDTGVCATSATGAAARIHTIATTPDLSGVDLGIRSTVKATFKVLEEGKKAIVCAVDGVYFSKLIVRKNLKAFTVDLNGTGEIKVWLAGAQQIPAC